MKAVISDIAGPIQEAHKQWGWYLTLGIAMVAIGAFAVYAVTAATIASVIMLGALLMVVGAVQLAVAFMARGAGRVILLLLAGALDLFVGVMLMEHPEFGAVVVTMFLAVLFVFGGFFRFIAALVLQFPHYGWVAFGGIVSVALGVLLWMQWLGLLVHRLCGRHQPDLRRNRLVDARP